MRQMFVVLTLVFFCFGQVESQDEHLRELGRANSAYENGQYDIAIAGYQSLILEGIRDAIVYFNLGNAYYETGKLGMALVHFLRAQQIEPRDIEISTNIANVRAERVDLQGGESNLIDRLSSSTVSVLTVSELGWIVFTLWALWMIVLTGSIWRNDWRTHIRRVLAVLGACMLIGIVLLGSRLYVLRARSHAVVTDLTIQVMSGPGHSYLPIFQLYAAAEVKVIDKDGEWSRIVLPEGWQGWVNSTGIEEV